MPINAEILRRYMLPSKTLIETGTHVGDGVIAAMAAGYRLIFTCDLMNDKNDDFRERCKAELDKYNPPPEIGDFIEDSREFLKRVHFYVMEPATFWLDAHATDGGAGSYADCPLLGELAEIAKHPVKEHTILIDDIRLIGSDALRLDRTTDNYSMWKLLDAIRNINPNYRCELIHSPLFCFDILACTAP